MIMLIFEDGEEAVIQNILSMAGTKARVYEAGFQDRCTLAFPGLVLDVRKPYKTVICHHLTYHI